MERLKILMVTRNTLQESLVFEAVNELRNHATADEIYELIVKKYPGISKGTVYRNLQQLSENGIISRVSIPDQPDRFDGITTPHYHAVCSECGSITDVFMENMADIDGLVASKTGLDIVGHEIVFKIICPVCKNRDN